MRLTVHSKKDRLRFGRRDVWVASLAQESVVHHYHIHPMGAGFVACFTTAPNPPTARLLDFPPEEGDTVSLGRYSSQGEAIAACSTHAEVWEECYRQ